VVNTSMVDRPCQRPDITVVEIPANEIAERLGDRRMTNMVLLGGLLAQLPVVSMEAVDKALKEHLPERHQKLLPLNRQAMQEGASQPARV
jgi:2-oxoglutarate ferredoxin oxidoreductase subunit gamma